MANGGGEGASLQQVLDRLSVHDTLIREQAAAMAQLQKSVDAVRSLLVDGGSDAPGKGKARGVASNLRLRSGVGGGGTDMPMSHRV